MLCMWLVLINWDNDGKVGGHVAMVVKLFLYMILSLFILLWDVGAALYLYMLQIMPRVHTLAQL